MKTANLSIVFTDIKGFTERTSAQTLEQNQRLLRTHNDLLAPLFKVFGGKIIKSIGDAFLVTFESPTQSVLCGIAIQDRLWLYNRTVPEAERFDVRVAINAGEVRVENNDVFGEPVNIASRVEGVAEAGWVYFTEAVFLAMNKAEVPAEEVGLFELKGIPGKVKVFRVPKAPYRVEAPAPAAQTQQFGPVTPGADDAMPPYGNLGLGKVSDDPTYKALAAAGGVASGAAELASKIMGKTTEALANAPRKFPVSPKMLGGVAVALVLLVVVAMLAGSGGPEGAIKDVKKASGRERDQKVEVARKEIEKVKDPLEKTYYLGLLEEAQGRNTSAINRYEDAAAGGEKKAVRRLLEMLESPTCAVRSAAAQALGSAKVKKAKGALEDLAENGGSDDSGNTGLLAYVSCNSKDAAKNALKVLEGSE